MIIGHKSSQGALKKIDAASLAGVATLELSMPAGRVAFLLLLDGLAPDTDGVSLFARLSNDGGVSFLSGASDYAWNGLGKLTGAGSPSSEEDSADSEIHLNVFGDLFGNAAGEKGAGEILIINPGANSETTIFSRFFYHGDGATVMFCTMAGKRIGDEAHDTIQIFFSSGNIAAANYAFFEVR